MENRASKMLRLALGQERQTSESQCDLNTNLSDKENSNNMEVQDDKPNLMTSEASGSGLQPSSICLRLKREKNGTYEVQGSTDEDFSGEESEYNPYCDESSSSVSSDSSYIEKSKIDIIQQQISKSPSKIDQLPPQIDQSPDKVNPSPPKKGKKRIRKPQQWKKHQRKTQKNAGQKYISTSGKTVGERVMGPVCNCKLLCSTKFTEDQRTQLFKEYWSLGALQRQRDFLASCIAPLQVMFRRIQTGSLRKEPRKQNCSFSLLNNGLNIRVCKPFLLNTLGIKERTLRTVINAKSFGSGVVPEDKRGKHTHHVKLQPEVLNSIREHINSIPRIESHYLRAKSSREFIDGGLTIAEMHRNYEEKRNLAMKPAATYDSYSRIFNEEFNLGFFVPKKDQCDQCEEYKNAIGETKSGLEEKYKRHLEEKELSRKEKATDIEKAKNPENMTNVAIYDLQAVLPVPLGESSAFFYKSKLNCYNFTVTNITNNYTKCFFWHEGLGHRGAVEIGTCVLKFLEEDCKMHPNHEYVFYSDNCCGQQKNRFVLAMYLYAVSTLKIKSITHKYLIRGHTQNEGDSVHSVIEKNIKRAKKSGPIYVPDTYISLIRSARKKGPPYQVLEMGYKDFVDLKLLTDEMSFNIAKNSSNDQIKIAELKMVKFEKGMETYKYKTSFEGEWILAPIRSRGRAIKIKPLESIKLMPAYTSKIAIANRKKEDLLHLLKTNIIPQYYETFYNSLF